MSASLVLKDSFSSFAQLDARCHALSLQYKGKTIAELKEMLGITTSTKDMAAICVIHMFGTDKLASHVKFKTP